MAAVPMAGTARPRTRLSTRASGDSALDGGLDVTSTDGPDGGLEDQGVLCDGGPCEQDAAPPTGRVFDDDGCECSHSTLSDAVPWTGVLLVVLLLGLRRRRRLD